MSNIVLTFLLLVESVTRQSVELSCLCKESTWVLVSF
jgi:hypothetical protein